MEPDIRHFGMGRGAVIIHNRYVCLDRKGISLNQNDHRSLQTWLSKPLLSSLAGYIMVSLWKMDGTITVFPTTIEMCEADSCLPDSDGFSLSLRATAEMSHGGWHCHSVC